MSNITEIAEMIEKMEKLLDGLKSWRNEMKEATTFANGKVDGFAECIREMKECLGKD